MYRICFLIVTFLFVQIRSQEDLAYQDPPEEILRLVDVTLPPRVLMDDKKNYMIYLYRDTYKTIEDLSEKEMRLAGLRLNPKTNIGSRVNYYKNIKISYLRKKKSKAKQIKGMPSNPKIANIKWSPDQTKIAMTNTTTEGVELWYLDLKKGKMKKLTSPDLNANLGDVINWFHDGESMLVKFVSPKVSKLFDANELTPIGPRVSTNDGKKAQNRTYQDLLKNKNDEKNFEILGESELYRVTLKGGKSLWKKKEMYDDITFSPDGKFILISIIQKPFSYLVPYYRFSSKYLIYSFDGKQVKLLENVPLIEDLPKGFMAVREGGRSFSWRLDKPSTIYFVRALDGGDPKINVEFRDEIFELEAPFNTDPNSILKTKNRYYDISWCNDTLALGFDYWWNNRNTKTYLFNPSQSTKQPIIVSERNYQDRYNDPGDFVKKRNKYGRYILALKDENLFLLGDGFKEDGQFPFLDQFNIRTNSKERLYESNIKNKKESLRDFMPDEGELLVRIESPSEYPNYYFRSLKKDELNQITFFSNPFKSLQNVYKELIKYKRKDGLDLSATLYLPEDYDKVKKDKLPMIMWAYPREFKDQVHPRRYRTHMNSPIPIGVHLSIG